MEARFWPACPPLGAGGPEEAAAAACARLLTVLEARTTGAALLGAPVGALAGAAGAVVGAAGEGLAAGPAVEAGLSWRVVIE
ncbi:hypothetical protein ACH4E7_25985 [Kitasatospora sp. NPDC018058]|uniref:hypothetical protein n=1 Tax=Kitasatospora sp. NPDC018058 TaxID=3364025 RepID=UPI0037C0ADC6